MQRGGKDSCYALSFPGSPTVDDHPRRMRSRPAFSRDVLYSFTGGSDGAAPAAGLIADEAGNLFFDFGDAVSMW